MRVAWVRRLDEIGVRLGLPHQVDDVGERHVAMMRAGIVAPAHVHAQLLRGDVAHGVVQRLDVNLEDLAEFGEARVLIMDVAAHREIGAVELHMAPDAAIVSYSWLHRFGDGEDVGLVARIIFVLEEEGDHAGRRRGGEHLPSRQHPWRPR